MNGVIKSWSDLPVDILSIIVELLSFDDQIRFRAVCKSWRWNTYAIKSADHLPWLFVHHNPYLYHDEVSDFCYLYNPSNKTKYKIKRKLPFGSRFLDSKYGWILISHDEEENLYYHHARNLLFFYNPFTDETIKLSVLESPLCICMSQVIFSGNPTSRECMIFVVVKKYSESMKIYTCRSRDTRWTLHSCLEVFEGHILSLACVDGVLYCASSYSRFEGENFLLSSFQIIAKEQEIVLDPINVLSFEIPSGAIYNGRLIGSDGNALLTYYEDDNCFVFRVDFSEKKLVEFENLGKKILFRGWEKCMLVPAVGAATELANTVHYNCVMKFNSHFYKAPETHLCPQPYGWIKKSEKSDSENIWIQPPLNFTRYQKITTPVHSVMIGSIRVPIRIQHPSPSR